jgi:predicted peroxiredoxin
MAFALALSSRESLGIETTVFLVGEGAIWAVEGASARMGLAGFPPLFQLVADYRKAGGKLVVCSTCTEAFCTTGKGRRKKAAPLMKDVERVGFTYISHRMVVSSTVTF